MKTEIYLDYNATAPIRPEVIDRVAEVMREGGNPSSVHGAGRKAKARLETARRQIADLVDCKPQEVIFTSGGTESNNLALLAFAARPQIVSSAEHDSILAVDSGRTVKSVDIQANGEIDPEHLAHLLDACEEAPLVSIMFANNETGVLQPIREIAELVHEKGGIIHTDAIQCAGKIPVSFRDLGVDMMSLSAHKIGGPQGQGALVLREGLAIQSIQKGGGQELGRRGGTENVAGISGFGLAAELAGESDQQAAVQNLARLRDYMEQEITAVSKEVKIYGKQSSRLPNTSCISMPGVGSELQVMNFDLAGIAISAGSACSSGKVKASHVLTAMGASEKEAAEAIRVSLGRLTKASDIDKFIEVWKKLYTSKRR
ncbi:MAG: cysteine desulfurase [Sneathiellales bacterium]|nr:cysteine desulfurase [Sneathiellales bacterium]